MTVAAEKLLLQQQISGLWDTIHRLVNYRVLQNSPVINKRSKPILLFFNGIERKKSHPRHQTQKENNSVSFHAITAAYTNALIPQKKNR